MNALSIGLAAALILAGACAAQPAPTLQERHPGMVVEPFVFAAADGTRLRAVVTKPRREGRLPAVLYVQALSCDTIAIPAAPRDGWEMMLQSLVRDSGALVWRTEKRGVGGSEGRCELLDYDTELADHRGALAALRKRPDVDPKRIVIYGASMGSNMAPLLAADQELAGVVVWGGGARTWVERTLAFERNRVELGAAPPGGRSAEMTAKYRLLDRWLIGGVAPNRIAAEEPTMAAVWSRFAGSSQTGMYGRPFAFHEQAQRQDWPGAWARVRAPVLALFGEYDWFEDVSGVELIGEIVNRASPGRARVVVFPGYDHHFARHPSRRAAFTESGAPDPGPIMQVMLPWLQDRFGP